MRTKYLVGGGFLLLFLVVLLRGGCSFSIKSREPGVKSPEYTISFLKGYACAIYGDRDDVTQEQMDEFCLDPDIVNNYEVFDEIESFEQYKKRLKIEMSLIRCMTMNQDNPNPKLCG